MTARLYLQPTVAGFLRQTFRGLDLFELDAYALYVNMAPHPGIDTDQIREKARKDLLDLLEGVCKAHQIVWYLSVAC